MPQQAAPDPEDKGRQGARAKAWLAASVRIAFVAGAFSAVVGTILVIDRIRTDISDPLNYPELTALKEKLVAQPKNAELKERIRALDLELRQWFFRRQALVDSGKYVVLGGVIVLLLGLKLTAELAAKPPRPGTGAEGTGEARLLAASRLAVGGLAALICGASAAWGIVWTVSQVEAPAATAEMRGGPTPTATAQPSGYPTPEEIRVNWPYFRGPTGMGVAVAASAPTAWSAETGEGIVWKTPVPMKGSSSPIIWGSRLFLTGADFATREVYCFDVASGKLQWRTKVAGIPGGGTVLKKETVWDEGTHAAATPVTDGRRVCAIFANGDLICLDMDGNRAWARGVGPLKNGYGHASSLAMYRDKLFVLLDQAKPEDGDYLSHLMALNAATGEVVWDARRQVRDSWSTPVTMQTGGGPQLVVSADPWTAAYDPETGKELWKAKGLKGDVVPSPIFAHGLVIAAMDGSELIAVRPDGSGDVTATHIAWRFEDDLPSISTPVADESRLYLQSSSGILTCLELATGKKLYDVDLELSFLASPTLVGDRLYMFSDEGEAVIAKASSKHELVGKAALGEVVSATPAFVGGRIYVRSQAHLYCIGDGSR